MGAREVYCEKKTGMHLYLFYTQSAVGCLCQAQTRVPEARAYSFRGYKRGLVVGRVRVM